MRPPSARLPQAPHRQTSRRKGRVRPGPPRARPRPCPPLSRRKRTGRSVPVRLHRETCRPAGAALLRVGSLRGRRSRRGRRSTGSRGGRGRSGSARRTGSAGMPAMGGAEEARRRTGRTPRWRSRWWPACGTRLVHADGSRSETHRIPLSLGGRGAGSPARHHGPFSTSTARNPVRAREATYSAAPAFLAASRSARSAAICSIFWEFRR